MKTLKMKTLKIKLIIALLATTFIVQAQYQYQRKQSNQWKELGISAGLIFTEVLARYYIINDKPVLGATLEGIFIVGTATRLTLDIMNNRNWQKNIASELFIRAGTLYGFLYYMEAQESEYKRTPYEMSIKTIIPTFCVTVGFCIAIE